LEGVPDVEPTVLDRLAARVEHMASVVRRELARMPTGGLGGVFGVGIDVSDGRATLVLDITNETSPHEVTGTIRNLAAPPGEPSWEETLADIRFRPGLRAIPSAYIGDAIGNPMAGTWGGAVAMSNSAMALLTAGHVLTTLGYPPQITDQNGVVVGTVADWVDPITADYGVGSSTTGQYLSGDLLADVAIVVCPAGSPPKRPTSMHQALCGTYIVKANDNVDIHTAGGTVSDTIDGWREFQWMQTPGGGQAKGFHGGCYLTHGRQTGAGDSGSLVTYATGSGPAVTGHVVGMTATQTIVQGIYWQLAIVRSQVAQI
jgi:hypothetical protein